MYPKLQQDIDKVLADLPRENWWRLEDVIRSPFAVKMQDFAEQLGAKNVEVSGDGCTIRFEIPTRWPVNKTPVDVDEADFETAEYEDEEPFSDF